MNPMKFKKIVELTAELQDVFGAEATFIYADDNQTVLGVLVADAKTTDAIMGPENDHAKLN